MPYKHIEDKRAWGRRYARKWLIVDDPFKDHVEAHSLAAREKVWDWYLSTAFTRLSPGGAVIIIMTRWNADDLVGRLLDPKRQRELEDVGVDTETAQEILRGAQASEISL